MWLYVATPVMQARGTKRLRQWLASPYCTERNINQKTVASVVKRFLKMFPD